MKQPTEKVFHAVKTTRHRWLRTTLGALLVVGGLIGFLPVLGFWMIPLGLALLAVDWPLARRLHRSLLDAWKRLRQKFRQRH